MWLVEAWDESHLVATAKAETDCKITAIAPLQGGDRVFCGTSDGHLYEVIVHSRAGLKAIRQLQMVS